MFDISLFKKSIAGFAGQLAQLRQQIEALQQQREELVNAAASKADIKAMVASWVAERARAFEAPLRVNLNLFVLEAKNAANPQAVIDRMTIFGKSGQYGGIMPTPEMHDMAMCLLVGPAIVKALHAAIDDMEWPAGALPLEGRAKKLTELDGKISKLVLEEAELVKEAGDAGVRFD